MNKKKVHSYFLYIVPLFYILSANGYFYRADYWFKGNQNLILLSDCHEASSKQLKQYLRKAQEQREDLLEFLESTDSFVIVEDLDGLTLQIDEEVEVFLNNPCLFNPNRDLGLSLDCLLWQLQSCESPLISFTQCCHALEIPVANVDFRFFTIDFLQEHLTADDIYALDRKVLSEISSYRDSPALNNIYHKKLSKFRRLFRSCRPFYHNLIQINKPLKKALHRVRYDSSLDQVIKHISYKSHRFFSSKKASVKQANTEVKKLSAHDKKRMIIDDLFDELLDLKILHHIYKNRRHDTIVVLAGGAHIQKIEKHLPLLGYSKTRSTGTKASLKKESPAINLRKVFNLSCYL